MSKQLNCSVPARERERVTVNELVFLASALKGGRPHAILRDWRLPFVTCARFLSTEFE